MLFECHGHIILSGRDYAGDMRLHESRVVGEVIDERLRVYAQAGVGFFRDGGDASGACIYAKQAAARWGIDYRTPLFAIYKKGLYGKNFGRSFSTLDELRDLIREAAQGGADLIKLMVTGLMDFRRNGALTPAGVLSDEELKTAVACARAEGLSVMAHCNGAENIARALRAGCGSIEHGYFIDDNCLSLLRETGAVWVPTVTPVQNLIGGGAFSDDTLRSIVEAHRRAIAKAAAMGCLVAPGSDAGSGGVYPETCTRQEYDTLLQSGMTPAQLKTGAKAISDRFKRN